MKILVFYSGGKDSQACLIWAANKYGTDKIEAVFCDTGWENPATYEHIKTTTAQMGVGLVTLKSSKYDGMIDLAQKKKRFPSTKARFCTEELKLKPAIDYVLSLDDNVIVVEGIRKNESLSRSKMEPECMYFRYYFEAYGKDKDGRPRLHTYRKRDVVEWCKKYNADKLRPIFEWTAQQTIDYIRDNGQQPNPLYFQGFKRVGCFPCIMASKGEIKRIIEIDPQRWEYLKQTEMNIGPDEISTFFPPDYIPKYARTSRSRNGVKIGSAGDVETYLARRDATLDLWNEETPSCMSAYNLCE